MILQWQPDNDDEFFAIVNYTRGTDLIIELDPSFINSVGLFIKPMAVEVNFQDIYNNLTSFTLDGITVNVYGRYRSNLLEFSKVMVISGLSASGQLKFYSKKKFKDHFVDNTISVNGQLKSTLGKNINSARIKAFSCTPLDMMTGLVNQYIIAELKCGTNFPDGLFISSIVFDRDNTKNNNIFYNYGYVANTNVPGTASYRIVTPRSLNTYNNKLAIGTSFRLGLNTVINNPVSKLALLGPLDFSTNPTRYQYNIVFDNKPYLAPGDTFTFMSNSPIPTVSTSIGYITFYFELP